MLFFSYLFVFVFFPITAIVFFLLAQRGYHQFAFAFLVAASLFFYGWWNPYLLPLLLSSILFNYTFGLLLQRRDTGASNRALLTVGVIGNLTLLGYYKYANFFTDEVNRIFGTSLHLDTVVLPLAISFFTLQQIAYLVDAYRGEVREKNLLRYFLFVSFFPQLIAGPIVHHKEMLPQFLRTGINRLRSEHIAVGLTIFSIGIFKKVVLADGIAGYSDALFGAASAGSTITFFEAWGGALIYTFQIYFDFSGYSDMAIGLARVFGIRIPLNFSSPYKAVNIIDFWGRWHITLTRFLRDYVYIALGGNRRGQVRRHLNIFTTMLVGGLWHGASWTFVFWGVLHGLYLICNHGFHALRRYLGHDLKQTSLWGRAVSQLVTFIAVVVGWVFFRAESFDAATAILKGMAAYNGFHLSAEWFAKMAPIGSFLAQVGIQFDTPAVPLLLPQVLWIVALLLISWGLPNTQEFMRSYRPAIDYRGSKIGPLRPTWLRWRPIPAWAIPAAVMMMLALFFQGDIDEFIYFQF